LGDQELVNDPAKDQCAEEDPVQRWMVLLVVGLTAIAAASSSYTAYKLYQMGDGRLVPQRSKR
jgi:hypothetical protein